MDLFSSRLCLMQSLAASALRSGRGLLADAKSEHAKLLVVRFITNTVHILKVYYIVFNGVNQLFVTIYIYNFECIHQLFLTQFITF